MQVLFSFQFTIQGSLAILGVHFYRIGHENLCRGKEKQRVLQILQQGYIGQISIENYIHNSHHTHQKALKHKGFSVFLIYSVFSLY